MLDVLNEFSVKPVFTNFLFAFPTKRGKIDRCLVRLDLLGGKTIWIFNDGGNFSHKNV
jgi:hypothetical protein